MATPPQDADRYRKDESPPLRVLVVDDDRSVRQLVVRTLEVELHASVSEAADGALALNALVQGPFDLVLLDLHMPVVDGLTTLKRIRRSPRCRTIPIVMFTGSGDEALIREAIRYGVSDYVLKPFVPSELVRRLTRLSLAAPAPLEEQALPDETPREASPPCVLLLGIDDGFARTMRQALGQRRPVVEVAGVSDAVDLVLRLSPAVVMVSGELDDTAHVRRTLLDDVRTQSVPTVIVQSADTAAPRDAAAGTLVLHGVYDPLLLRNALQALGLGSLIPDQQTPLSRASEG